MPRTMRPLAKPTVRVRRRHRTWMRAMTLATLGWGIIWLSMASAKLGWQPPVRLVYAVAGVPAVLGLGYALLSFRARKSWLLMAAAALFANGSLVALPILFDAEFREALASFSKPETTTRPVPGSPE